MHCLTQHCLTQHSSTRHSATRINFILVLAGVCALLVAPSLFAQKLFSQASVRTVEVLSAKDAVEVEVGARDRIMPQTPVLTGPDRLVVDFPNAVPSRDLCSQSV